MAVFERIVSQARIRTWLHRSFCSSSSSPKPVPISSHQESASLEQSKSNVQNTRPLDSREFNPSQIYFAAKDTDLIEWEGDILAVGVTEKDMAKDENSKFQNSILKKLDSQLHGLLSKIYTKEDFTGKAGQSTVIWIAGLGSKRVDLIGLRKVPIGSSTFAYCNLGESVASAAKASQANNVAIALASSDDLTHEMKLATASAIAKEIDLIEWKGDILAVGVTEKDMAKDENSKFQNSILKKLDSQLHGLLSEISTEEDFTGKAGQSTVIRIAGLGSKRVNLIGLGNVPIGLSTFAYRNLGESVASAAKASQANNVAIALASSDGLTPEMKLTTASAIAKGALLGTYEDNRFKSESKKPVLKSVDFFGLGAGPELEKKLKYTEDVCAGIILGKELVNAPTNVLTPEVLAEEAEKIASTYSDVLSATILDTEQCKDLKMGSNLGVAAASTNPPKFIHLCYKPPNGCIKTKLAIVGKGLTFDRGGYNIKTGANCSIEMIKVDKGGSAAVLGAAKALGQIKPAGVEVHFIVASETGMRLGDILTASNGKTIEVNITDAEGRLTLADALVYACNQGVDKIVDLATMTGACSVALGPSIAGIFTPSDELSKEVVAASEVAGEKLCRLPMEESYWASMKSGVADMVNTDGHEGIVFTAALFLKQFVDDKVQWLHIDMAGPVWNDEKNAATGFGISTLVEWVLSNSSS